uniref:non-specific serine/threonine protein kinase n=1 Tax=Cajanus cajan TaxID=3821 RepID=A0A151SPK3_CAJCA|nr:Receptor-like protein kinase [Cajanus cajan]
MRLLLLFSCLFYAVSALTSDGVTLLSLMKHCTSLPHSINTTWLASDSTPCSSWVGVQCNHAHNVVYLNLTGFGIAGQLGPEIGNITWLQRLDLTDNNFHGQIPDTFKNLHNLKFLSLSYNQLCGEIPDSLTQISPLHLVDLSHNNINGSIPTSIGNTTQLLWLYLHSNNLSGTIPSSIGNCSKLQHLFLDRNQLEGILPQSLNNLNDLASFGVPRNKLTGTITLGSKNCKNLQYLDLSFNEFSGGLPSSLGNCSGLSKFAAVNCNLVGNIPASFGLLTKLSILHLPENHLSGKIPPEIGNCKSLEELHLYSNRLEGNIPSELGKLSKLVDLELFTNQLTGEIPLSIWKIKGLEHLLVYNNSLYGELPLEMTELKKLKNISLFNNQFSGVIPQSLGINSSLVQLILKQNNFTGPLPDFESNPNLAYMDISNNKIHGAIPSSLGNCRSLTDLNLSMNKFTGLIPSELGNLVNLRILNLAHNNLEGPLPSQLSNYFLSEFKMLFELQLGGNMFGGKIPRSVGTLQNLMYGMNLSSNGLIGDIPAEIRNLKKLQALDLSQNNLTGSIEILGELFSLLELNISFNSFGGRVPKKLMKLLNSLSPWSSFMGNPGLCISCSASDGLACTENSSIKQCDDNKSTKQKGLSNVQIVMITLGPSIFVVLLLLRLVYVHDFVFGSKAKQQMHVSDEEGSSSLLNTVMEATANLNDRYIIGRGAHGVVYKASVGPDKAFAVKNIEFAASKIKKLSMVKEIQTLERVRHRNLLKLEGFWFGKDNGLILYSYMPNGSLHDVLHERTPPMTLEWNVRYKIAVGIAHGLAYLHHDCDPSIVHRDIKPTNILLNSDMEPHIADFGIAKLLDQPSASNPSICVPGTIGYAAPDFVNSQRESDVYSYGVVLLELITRKKAADPSYTEGTNVVDWVRSMWMETGEVNEIVDASLAKEFTDTHMMEEVTKVLMVALRCAEKDPHK